MFTVALLFFPALPLLAAVSITDVRLSSSAAGRLEVQDSNGQWWGALELCVPVSADSSSTSSSRQLAGLESALADVACRQLGFPGGRPLAAYTPSMQAPPAGPVLSALLVCAGNETSVDQASLAGEVLRGWGRSLLAGRQGPPAAPVVSALRRHMPGLL